MCSIKGLPVFVEFFCILLRPLHGPTATSGPRSPTYRGFTSTLRHAHSVGLLWTSDRSTQRPLPNNHNTHKRQISYSSDEIRTRDPSKRAAQTHTSARLLGPAFGIPFLFKIHSTSASAAKVFLSGRPSPKAPLSKLFVTKCNILSRFL